jgi:hypothetical protein
MGPFRRSGFHLHRIGLHERSENSFQYQKGRNTAPNSFNFATAISFAFTVIFVLTTVRSVRDVNKSTSHIRREHTPRMQAIRMYLSARALRKLDSTEYIRALRLERYIESLFAWIWISERGKVHPRPERMPQRRNEYDARDVSGRARCEQLRQEELGEEERPEVARRHLVLQPVDGELKGPNGGSGVVD